MRRRSWVVLVAPALVMLFDAGDGVAAPQRPAVDEWEQVLPGGDCQCWDGSEFGFWVREASQEKVVLYLEDGGACFSAETCDPDSGRFQTTLGEGPTARSGIFDLGDTRNPLAGHSMVYVPYCTADVHLGDTTAEYADGRTVQHRGLANGTAALDQLAGSFPDATDIVVIGESAGSVAAPVYGGLVADRFPDATVTVLADGSGSYPDDPAFNRLLEAWGAATAIEPWAGDAGSGGGLSAPGLFVLSGGHDPDITFARLDFAYDERQTPWYELLGVPVGDLLARIEANEAQIEQAGIDVASYVAAGTEHMMLSEGSFTTQQVDGQLLVDWVTRLIAGESVADVRCTECAGLGGAQERSGG